jgi:hypothetical protein
MWHVIMEVAGEALFDLLQGGGWLLAATTAAHALLECCSDDAHCNAAEG